MTQPGTNQASDPQQAGLTSIARQRYTSPVVGRIIAQNTQGAKFHTAGEGSTVGPS